MFFRHVFAGCQALYRRGVARIGQNKLKDAREVRILAFPVMAGVADLYKSPT